MQSPEEERRQTPEERRAHNEVRLRDANERIERTAIRLEIQELIPFICECFRPDCIAIIRLYLQEYEQVRADPTLFIYAPEHEPSSPETTVIEQHDRYLVVGKSGEAARIATHDDPRA